MPQLPESSRSQGHGDAEKCQDPAPAQDVGSPADVGAAPATALQLPAPRWRSCTAHTRILGPTSWGAEQNPLVGIVTCRQALTKQQYRSFLNTTRKHPAPPLASLRYKVPSNVWVTGGNRWVRGVYSLLTWDGGILPSLNKLLTIVPCSPLFKYQVYNLIPSPHHL